MSDKAVRVADLTVRWNVVRHFYPYYEEENLGWDRQLELYLQQAVQIDLVDSFEELLAWYDLLCRFFNPVKDGHPSKGCKPAAPPQTPPRRHTATDWRSTNSSPPRNTAPRSSSKAATFRETYAGIRFTPNAPTGRSPDGTTRLCTNTTTGFSTSMPPRPN